MQTLSIIFTIIFLIILIAYLFIASHRKTLKNIFCLITNIITFIMTILITKLTISLAGSKIIPALSETIKEVLNINKDEWIHTDSIELITKFISTIIIGLISFFFIFIILYIINHLLKRLIFKLIKKVPYGEYESPKPDNKLVNVGISLVSFIVISFAFLYPLGTFIKITDVSTKATNYNVSILKPVLSNPVIKIYSNTISESIFNTVTKIKDYDNKIKNTDELTSLTTIVLSLSQMEDSDNINDQINVIKESFTNTYLAPAFVSEVCANAANSWKENKTFMGNTLDIPEDSSKDIYIDLLDIISKWDRDSLVNDIDTIFEFYDILDKHNILDIEDSDEFISSFTDDEFTEELFLCLFRNDDFKSILSSFMNYGIKSSLSNYDLNLDINYVETAAIMELSDEEIKNEAQIFSLTVRQLVKLNEAKGRELTKDEYLEIANNLSKIHKSKILSDSVYNLMNKLLASAAK